MSHKQAVNSLFLLSLKQFMYIIWYILSLTIGVEIKVQLYYLNIPYFAALRLIPHLYIHDKPLLYSLLINKFVETESRANSLDMNRRDNSTFNTFKC